MKICFFANALNVHVRHLAEGFARRAHEVHVVTHKPVDIPGVSVERFSVPLPGLANPRRWHGRRTHYLRGFLRRFDVVVVFFLHDWGFTPQMLEDGCLIASPRGSDIIPPPGETPPSPELVEKRVSLLRHAAGVGVGGPTFAGAVAKFAGIERDRIDLLPLGVDLDLFQPVEPSQRSGRNGHRVGFFRGFREVYGSTCLLQAIPQVVQELPDTGFDLIGEGPQLERCKELARKLGVESSIRWIPPQPHPDIPKYLAGWDVTVMPSLCESFGLAALESSATRVPVVASNVGGLIDTVRHQVTGVLVLPQKPRLLADAIITLLADPTLRYRMGRAGRDFVRGEYEWSEVQAKWLAVFERALDRVCTMV